MKFILLVLFLAFELFGSVVKSPVVLIDKKKSEVTIEIDKIDVGMSGFLVHKIADGRTIILKNAVVKSYDKNTKIAILGFSNYNALRNSALPSGNWEIQVGDTAILAFGYTRGLLIAPSEEVYYRVTRNSALQWVHPDIFATILSFNGHPTPLREDFTKMSIATSVGLTYIFLEKKIYTLDSKSFTILTVMDADLLQDEVHLPFYTRVPEIDSNWFGDGNDDMEAYEPHYYELLIKANPKHTELCDIVKKNDIQAKLDEESGKEEFEDLDEDRYEDAIESCDIIKNGENDDWF